MKKDMWPQEKTNRDLCALILSVICSSVLFWQGCMGDHIKVVRHVLAEQRTFPVTDVVLAALSDSIRYWSGDRVRMATGYSRKSARLGGVLYTHDKSRCLIYMLYVDTAKDATHDDIEMFSAERYGRSWYFFVAGMPSVSMPIAPRASVANRFEALDRELIGRLCRSDIIDFTNVDVCDSAINRWFFLNRFQLHAKFLKDTIQ